MANNDTVFGKILAFSKLEAGWHFGDGDSFPENVVAAATSICWEAVSSGTGVDVFPCMGGGLVVVLYKEPYCVEFTIDRGLSVDCECEHGDTIVVEFEGLSLSTVLDMTKCLGTPT